MNIYDFKNSVYIGDIARDFFVFCLKKNKKLVKYLFVYTFLYLASFFSTKCKKKYFKIKYSYFKELKNIDKLVKEFAKISQNKKNLLVENLYKNDDLVIAKYPEILVKNFLKKKKYIAYELNDNFEVINDFDVQKYIEGKEVNILMNSNLKDMYLDFIKCDNMFLCKKSLNIRIDNYKTKIKNTKKILLLSSFILIPLFITLMSFIYANPVVDMRIIITYFQDIKLFLLNFLPILIIYLGLTFFTRRPYIGFGILSVIVLILGVVNQTKLIYRDDFFIFEDFLLFKEAALMATKYDIYIAWYTVVFVILILLITVILKKKIGKLKLDIMPRILLCLGMVFIAINVYKNTLTNGEIYSSVGDITVVNRWIATRQYQIRGFIYPFIYTSKSFVNTPPEGYDEEKVKEILSKYSYTNIEDNKKVNIIAIMLEAYNDFSKFEDVKFTEDIYKPLHNIQKKSYYGNLIVNVFGGGTYNTERGFINGYNNFPNFRRETNSYARYFKEQGYVVEAMHPVYGAFYNRNTANLNMGFDFYYNYENTFSNISSEFLKDWDFFDCIIKNYENSVNNNKPYFNFSVTYQNHGPYNPTIIPTNKLLIDLKENETANGIVNNYFNGIEKTNLALEKLVKYFDKQKEPVVVIFFGDHNPFLGDENLGFNAMGIDLSLNSIESFENYYSIPYVIHANETAKDVLGKDFIGKGNTISPMFLMNEFFDYVGWKGNEYLQYTSDLKKEVDVIHGMYYKSNGEYILKSNYQNSKLISEFNYVNYYWAFDEFKKK